jgi:pyrroloquinoline quinone biosynthesis protein B
MAMRPIINKFCKPLGLIIAISTLSSNNLLSQVTVHVLGIAQDAGRPQAGCKKICCVNDMGELRPPIKRTCLGVTLSDNNSLLIEATPDLTSQWSLLSKLNNDISPNSILITHAHVGHYTGLINLGREAMNTKKIDVFSGPRFIDFIKNNGPWDQLVKLNNIKLTGINEDESIQFSELKIRALKVPHRDEYSETYGYLFEGKIKTLLFIPDIDKWSKWDISIDSLIRKVDYALLDGTFYGQSELPNRDMSEIPHPFVSESIEQWEKWDASEKTKVYFIHFNHSNPLINRQSNEFINVLKKGFHMAKTGMSFEL